jgi:hypothetical protein
MMKTKLPPMCLLLVIAVAMSGCAGLVSGTGDNDSAADSQIAGDNLSAVDNLTAADNETVTVEPTKPEAPEAITSTPETPAEQLVLPKPVEHTGLTEEEWERAVQIALTLPELSEWLEKEPTYRAEPIWFWKRPGSTEWGRNSTYIPSGTPNVTDITPGVRVSLGSPQQVLFDIAVDLDSGETVTFVRFDDRLLPASQFNLRYLTEEEFAEVIRIASEATGATIDPATVEPHWVSINGIYHTRHDYDAVEKGVLGVTGIKGATFYPAVTIQGGPSGYQMVIVDLKNKKLAEEVFHLAPK